MIKVKRVESYDQKEKLEVGKGIVQILLYTKPSKILSDRYVLITFSDRSKIPDCVKIAL